MRRTITAPRKGFTLVELLVVIAIIGVLIGLLLPAVQAARESARRTACTNKLKQIGIAMHLYHDNKGKLPPAAVGQLADGSMSPDSGRAWSVDIMPFIEMTDLYDKYDQSRGSTALTASPGYSLSNRSLITDRRIPFQECPSRETFLSKPWSSFAGQVATISYGVCNGPQRCDGVAPDCYAGTNSFCSLSGSNWTKVDAGYHPGMFASKTAFQCRFSMVTDGLSKTLMIAETRGDLLRFNRSVFGQNFQGVPTGQRINSPSTNLSNVDNAYTTNMGAGSYHPSGALFCLGDGAVVFLNQGIDFELYNAIGGKADGITAETP